MEREESRQEASENDGDFKLANMSDGVYKVLEFYWSLKASRTIYEAVSAFDEEVEPLIDQRRLSSRLLSVAYPDKPTVALHRIHKDINILALILTLHVSYAITARKTAHMLKNIWDIVVSHQTVLNYVQTAAYHCHKFNLKHKGEIDDINAGDETYVKIKAVLHYVWFLVCANSKKIAAYHFSDNRGAKPAITAMVETVRTADKEQNITLVTDGQSIISGRTALCQRQV